MKLPNVDRAQIPQAKAVEYLLSPTHPEGAGKAEFFVALGFRHEEWEVWHDIAPRAEVYYRRCVADTERPDTHRADGVDC